MKLKEKERDKIKKFIDKAETATLEKETKEIMTQAILEQKN